MPDSQTDENGYERDEDGRFVPGGKRGPGRPKGSGDSTTELGRRVRLAILASFEETNGRAILKRLAEEDPAAYMTLLARCLPRLAAQDEVLPPPWTNDVNLDDDENDKPEPGEDPGAR